MSIKYFLIKGSLHAATRDVSGQPQALRDVGEVLLSLTVETEYVTNQPTRKALQGIDLHVPFSVVVKGSMKVKEVTKENLALMSFGEVVEQSSTTITNRSFPTGLEAGKTYQLPGGLANVSSAVITDSAGTPATLAAGTHYELDAIFGTIKIVSLASFTQPLKISCTAGVTSDVAIAKKAPEELFLLLKGTIITEGNKPVLLELYRTAVESSKELPGKTGSKEAGEYELPFTVLEDGARGEDPVLGSYGRYRLF